jgi:hypothetical protein
MSFALLVGILLSPGHLNHITIVFQSNLKQDQQLKREEKQS